MTPLPWWVFLALLLASVGVHPYDDACVYACRAERTTEIIGVCDQRLRQSSDGGSSLTQRLIRHCLTPCESDTLTFDHSITCRTFRRIFILSKGCSCDERKKTIHRKNNVPLENHSEHERYMLKTRILEIFSSILTARAKFADRNMLDGGIEDQRIDTEVEQSVKKAGENVEVITESVRDEMTTTPAPVDWEMWCMAQCTNGQGGSACNCDIIP